MDKSVRKMYRVKELMPGVYGISSSAVMTYLVVGQAGAMLIDTAYGFEDLSQVVRELTSLPVTVVNTHGHVDHSGGNFYFDSPTCIHEKDVEVYRRHNEPNFHRVMEKSLKLIQTIIFWRRILPKRPEINDEKRANFDHFRFVKEGDQFDLGGLTARIVEIPGHTQGSIAVLFPEKRLIITSDGACGGTYLFLPESTNLSTYTASLRKLEALEFDHILTGHVSELFPKSTLKDWIHVAEHLDLEHGKPDKGNSFLNPGVTPVRCWAKDDPKHKGPNIVVNPNKLD